MEQAIIDNSKGATYLSFVLDVEIVLKQNGATNLATKMVRTQNHDSKGKDQGNKENKKQTEPQDENFPLENQHEKEVYAVSTIQSMGGRKLRPDKRLLIAQKQSLLLSKEDTKHFSFKDSHDTLLQKHDAAKKDQGLKLSLGESLKKSVEIKPLKTANVEESLRKNVNSKDFSQKILSAKDILQKKTSLKENTLKNVSIKGTVQKRVSLKEQLKKQVIIQEPLEKQINVKEPLHVMVKEPKEKKVPVPKEHYQIDNNRISEGSRTTTLRKGFGRLDHKSKIFKGKVEPIDFLECNRIFMCNYLHIPNYKLQSRILNTNCFGNLDLNTVGIMRNPLHLTVTHYEEKNHLNKQSIFDKKCVVTEINKLLHFSKKELICHHNCSSGDYNQDSIPHLACEYLRNYRNIILCDKLVHCRKKTSNNKDSQVSKSISDFNDSVKNFNLYSELLHDIDFYCLCDNETKVRKNAAMKKSPSLPNMDFFQKPGLCYIKHRHNCILRPRENRFALDNEPYVRSVAIKEIWKCLSEVELRNVNYAYSDFLSCLLRLNEQLNFSDSEENTCSETNGEFSNDKIQNPKKLLYLHGNRSQLLHKLSCDEKNCEHNDTAACKNLLCKTHGDSSSLKSDKKSKKPKSIINSISNLVLYFFVCGRKQYSE